MINLPFHQPGYRCYEKKSGKVVGLASDFLAVEAYECANVDTICLELYNLFKIDVNAQRLFCRAIFGCFL